MADCGLGEPYEQWIDGLLLSGRYATRSDVLRDGLRLLEERERSGTPSLERLRALIAEGDESGEPEALDIEAIKADARSLRRRRTG